MGERKRRKTNRLKEHPFCCFCGGSSPTAEFDHQPCRAFFDGRDGPEGFEFPSCSKCNRSTSLNESIVAALARSGEVQPSKESQLEFARLMKEIDKDDPEVCKSLVPRSAAATMRLLKEVGYIPPIGETYNDQGLFKLGDRVHEAFLEFGRKLALSTYYKVTGNVLDPTGGTIAKYLSNYEVAGAGALFQSEGFGLIDSIHPSKRSGKDLSNQFQLRSKETECGEAVAFIAVLRDHMIVLGAAYSNPEGSSLIENHTFIPPYSW